MGFESSEENPLGLNLQKYLRLLIPGLFLYGIFVLLCWTTKWCELAMPANWEEASKLLAAFVLGALYHYSGLREKSNNSYHFDVNTHITRKLTQPFLSDIQGLGELKWNKTKKLFYHFIDKDESLKVKSEIIRFNGLLWTSIADLRMACAVGVIVFLGSVACSRMLDFSKFNEIRAIVPILILIILFSLSFWFSRLATDRHKRLSDDQTDYIIFHYKDELKSGLEKLASEPPS